jgi:hypothetical protein
MKEPKDMILPMLKEMRAEIRAGHDDLHKMFDAMEDRFTSTEKMQAECLDIVLDSIAAKAAFLVRSRRRRLEQET